MARQVKASGSKPKQERARRVPVQDVSEAAASSEEELDEDDIPDMEDEEDEAEAEEGVAQWAPDDWDEAGSDEGSGSGSDGSGDDDDQEGDDLGKLQRQMKSLPLSTLMKAQRSLQPQRQHHDDTESPDSDQDSTPGASGGPSTLKAKKLAEAKAKLAALQRKKGKAGSVPSKLPDLEDEDGSEDEWEDMRRQKQQGGAGGRGRDDEDGPKRERAKRDNKHAPTALGTKKQVSRSRQVIEQQNKNDRRDPRFDSMSSQAVSPHLQSQSYSFLPKLLKDELSGLRTAVKMASKAEANCPLSQKPARTAEREMLELQLGRLRTKIERGEREAKEREVLARVKKEENEKRDQGKGAWYLKKSEQKDVLLKARFENLEKKGGKSAVKKAMEKKRKKVAGKEKKSRPFAPGQGGGGGGSASGADGKRRRVA